MDNYNLDAILKKKRKNLYNRLHAAGKASFLFIESKRNIIAIIAPKSMLQFLIISLPPLQPAVST